jgi:hypothetical protein
MPTAPPLALDPPEFVTPPVPDAPPLPLVPPLLDEPPDPVTPPLALVPPVPTVPPWPVFGWLLPPEPPEPGPDAPPVDSPFPEPVLEHAPDARTSARKPRHMIDEVWLLLDIGVLTCMVRRSMQAATPHPKTPLGRGRDWQA